MNLGFVDDYYGNKVAWLLLLIAGAGFVKGSVFWILFGLLLFIVLIRTWHSRFTENI